jgi:hypothetical protein
MVLSFWLSEWYGRCLCQQCLSSRAINLRRDEKYPKGKGFESMLTTHVERAPPIFVARDSTDKLEVLSHLMNTVFDEAPRRKELRADARTKTGAD